jgi:hypothetical protein
MSEKGTVGHRLPEARGLVLRGPPTRLDSLTAAERRALIDECQAEAMADELKAETGLLDVDTTKHREDIRFASILAEVAETWRRPTWYWPGARPERQQRRIVGGDRVTVLQSEVYEAFRAIDIPEDKATKAATVLSHRDDAVSSLKGEILVIKWMMGFVLAMQVAVFAKVFIH